MNYEDGKKVFKCRYCYSEESLYFAPDWKKGDRPVRAIDGRPHRCRKDKVQEISSSVRTKKKYKNDRREFVHSRELSKKPKDWLLNIPQTETYRKCGKCGTELTTQTWNYNDINTTERRREFVKKTGCQCVILNKNWCDEFCSKCKKHPHIIMVTSEK